MSLSGVPSKGAVRRVGVVAMVALVVALGAAILCRRRLPKDQKDTPGAHAHAHVDVRADAGVAVRSIALPRDPLAFVPVSTRTLVVADLARLRSAPATRSYFADNTGTPSCQEAIARRVRTMALVIPRLPPDDFAFVATGELSPDDLARCVPDAVPVHHGDVALMALRARRDGGAGGVVVWTPQGVVLVGAMSVVEAMLDRALDVAHDRAQPLALEALRAEVTPDAALWALHHTDRAGPPHSPLAAVSVGVLSVMVTHSLQAEATLRCDDSTRARGVAESLGRLRHEIAMELTEPHLRSALEGATITVNNADVQLRAALSAEGTAALGNTTADILRRVSSALSTP